MDKNFWLQKWQDNEIRFHQSKYHPSLTKYAVQFSSGTILVPLCGKSLDMLYLASRGQHVIGVELSPIACRDFFVENDLKFTEKNSTDFTLYESENITLWCGDFFKLPQNVWNQVLGIYDRAALVALPMDVRQKYASEIAKRCKTKVEILLISFEYPEGSIEAPPFSVPEEEIKDIYQLFEMQKIHSEKFDVRGTDVVEDVYWLSKS